MASMEGNETSEEAVDENTIFASVAEFLRFLRTRRLSELPSAVSSTETSTRHSLAHPRSLQDGNSKPNRDSPHRSSSPEQQPASSPDPLLPFEKGTTEFYDYTIEEAIRRLEKIAETETDSRTMASTGRPQLVFTDGSLADHVQDLADYMHIGEEVQPLLAKDQHEEALAKIVRASSYLSTVPEKEFTPAYNLLVYLVINESKEPKKYLPMICSNLQKPISSSPVNGAGLALSGLQTVFNLIDSKSSLRYNVFMEILKFVKAHGMYDNLKGGLKNLPRWLETWDMDEEDQRKLYTEVADIALEAGEQEESYQYLLKALREFDASDDEEVKSEEAQKLALRALRMALLSNNQYDFQDLRALPTVQALSDSHPVYSQLLDLFAEQDLEDYNDFREEHEGWIEKEKLDHDRLQRKIRLLTFTSLAASTSSRQIEYKAIAKALQIPSEDVEMWAIDVIRAGLVEGKMSQQKQLFLVHRTTYRVFGEKQWRELGTRVDAWKHSLRDVLSAIRRSQSEAEAQKEREQQEMERRLQNASLGEGGQQGGSGGGQRRDRRQQQQQQQQQRREDDD